jgi:hypothetical protein
MDDLADENAELVDRAALVEGEEKYADAQPKSEDRADHGVAVGLTAAEQSDQQGGDHRAAERAVLDADAEQQGRGRAGEREFGGEVHREGHPANHDQRAKRPGDQAEHGAANNAVCTKSRPSNCQVS